MKRNTLLMRTLMFVPGHNHKLQQSAAKSDADVILLDIEDSVHPIDKQLARDTIKQSVSEGLFGNTPVYIRLNDRQSGFHLQDVIQTAIPGITGFLYPKTDTAADILFFDKFLETVELEKSIPVGTFKVIPILETASSVVNANEIAKSSERIVAIGFGSEDFVSDIEGIRDFEEAQSIFTPRAWVAMVARANNLVPIDAAYIKIHDDEGLEKHVLMGKKLGYAGMWTIHPKQNACPNRHYAPSQEEIDQAREILRLNDEAQKLRKGVAIINGSFIGPPLVVKANYVLERANLIGMKNK